MDKIGIALLAVFGGIAFVLAMIGFAAVSTYLGIIALLALAAGLVVTGIVRVLQVKVRMAVSFGFWATVFLVWAVGSMLSGHTLATLLSLIAGGALGLAHHLHYTPRIAKAVAEKDHVKEYTDADGHVHKYVLMGAQQLPPGLAKRPVLVAVAMLVFYAIVFVLIVTIPHWRSELISTSTILAIIVGALAGITVGGLFTAVKAEMKHDVELFHQAVPDEATTTVADWFSQRVPPVAKVVSETVSGLAEGIRYAWDASVRWS